MAHNHPASLAVRLTVFARDTLTSAELRSFARVMGVPDQGCTDAALLTRLPGWFVHLMATDPEVRQAVLAAVLAEASAPRDPA